MEFKGLPVVYYDENNIWKLIKHKLKAKIRLKNFPLIDLKGE
jgi:hypothetical protein